MIVQNLKPSRDSRLAATTLLLLKLWKQSGSVVEFVDPTVTTSSMILIQGYLPVKRDARTI